MELGEVARGAVAAGDRPRCSRAIPLTGVLGVGIVLDILGVILLVTVITGIWQLIGVV
ncbi:MAG: hypothetical protein V3T86_08380 [Planctomycetota bacterium]